MRFGYDIRLEVLCFQVENSFSLQYRESFVYTVSFISINALVFDPVTKISTLNSERACSINFPKKFAPDELDSFCVTQLENSFINAFLTLKFRCF